MRRRLGDALMPALGPAVEDGVVLGHGDVAPRPCRAASKSTSSAPRSPARSSSRETVKSRAPRPAGARGGAGAVDAVAAAPAERLDAAEVRRRVLPAVRAGEVDEPARGQRAREPLARLLVDRVPARVGDRRVPAQQVVAHRAPLGCRCRASRPAGRGRRSVVARRRPPRRPRRARRCRPPGRARRGRSRATRASAAAGTRGPSEVLELLADRVGHDRARVGVRLDRQALLVPADRLGLLGQRGAQARERARLGRSSSGRLVVLVESHAGTLPASA